MIKENFNQSINVKEVSEDTFVYFLFKGDTIVYIGQTTNGIERPLSHTSTKEFDTIKVIYCKQEDLNRLEKHFIEKYQPIYNKAFVKLKKNDNKVKPVRIKRACTAKEEFVFYWEDLSQIAFRIYSYMKHLAGDEKETKFPHRVYKRWCSKGSFQSALKELVEKEYITYISGKAEKKANIYVLLK